MIITMERVLYIALLIEMLACVSMLVKVVPQGFPFIFLNTIFRMVISRGRLLFIVRF